MSYFFDPNQLETVSREVVSRAYPSFDVIGEKPLYATNNLEIREAYKTQEDIRKNSVYHPLQNIMYDNVGASFYILSKLYKDNNWVYLGANVSAGCASACNPLFKIKSKSKAVRKVKDITDLLSNPNMNETGWELFYKTYLSLKKYGNSYWQVIKNKAGGIHSIYFLPSQNMRVAPFINKKTGIMEMYYFQINDFHQKVDRVFFQEEIIHFKMPNDDSILYGLAPLVPIFRDLTFDIESKNWINSWFQKTFTGGMVFEMKNASKDVVRRNRQEMKEKFEGSQNAGRNLILEGDMSIVCDGNKAKDLDLSGLKQISRDDILSSYEVPLSVAGVRSNVGATGSELIDSEEKAMLRNNVTKLQNIVFNTLNLKLFKIIMKDDDLTITAGTNQTFTMKNAESIVQSASKYAGTTINENREILSLPTKEDDDDESNFNKAIVSTNNAVVPLDELFNSFGEQSQGGIQPNTISIDKAVANKESTVVVNPEKKKVEVK